MMVKKILSVLVLLLLTNCGYQAIYSSKGLSNISILKIDLKGEVVVDRKLLSLLTSRLEIDPNSNDIIELNSKKEVVHLSKDNSGNIKIYNNKITTILILKEGKKLVGTKTFISDFSYNSIANNFDLQQYQKKIDQNLIRTVSEDILMYLISIK
tara:strand:+ start:48 stop:509 length:462 start_codon:yes stop_codon:yes gene_type:complete